MNWLRARSLVLDRDDHICQRCGKSASDAHHRQLKGSGGTSDPERRYGAANLVSLCRTCHNWVHAHPAESYRLGWLVHSWDEPGKVSVLLARGRLWLKSDGTRMIEEEPAYF